MNQKLLFARAYEREASRQIPEMARPKFHLSPCTGWMNDPNGFSFYKGEYHLFYQYNPYDTCWDTMHWGHAVSGDLLSWRYLPAAMAPNEWYDADGCWSGSAMEGRIELEHEGRRITIERSSTARAPLGVFRAFDTDSGQSIEDLTAQN